MRKRQVSSTNPVAERILAGVAREYPTISTVQSFLAFVIAIKDEDKDKDEINTALVLSQFQHPGRYAVGDLAAGGSGTVLFAVTLADHMPSGDNRLMNTVQIYEGDAQGVNISVPPLGAGVPDVADPQEVVRDTRGRAVEDTRCVRLLIVQLAIQIETERIGAVIKHGRDMVHVAVRDPRTGKIRRLVRTTNTLRSQVKRVLVVLFAEKHQTGATA